MDERLRVIKKIENLWKRAHSITSTEHLSQESIEATEMERLRAYQLALKLMDKYNITEADFSTETVETGYVGRYVLARKGRNPIWITSLAVAIGGYYRCKTLRDTYFSVIFVGNPSDTILAEQAFLSIKNRLELLVEQEYLSNKDHIMVNKKTWYNSFLVGAVYALVDKLRTIQDTSTNSALMIVNNDKFEEYVASRNSRIGNYKLPSSNINDPAAFKLGYSQNIQLQEGLT